MTCTSLLHLRQLGPTDPLTTKWASLVRFISYLWQVRTDAARLIRNGPARPGEVPIQAQERCSLLSGQELELVGPSRAGAGRGDRAHGGREVRAAAAARSVVQAGVPDSASIWLAGDEGPKSK